MSAAKITIIGFNNYLTNLNDDLFKYLNVPEGIDKDTLVNNILLRGAEFELLYSDPYFLQNMIGVWSNKWQRTMTRWVNALNIDYNPLENYDRYEDWEDNGSKLSSALSKNDVSSNKNIMSQSLKSDDTKTMETSTKNENAVSSDISNSDGSGETANTRSAYDSDTYQPHDKSESKTSGNNSSNGITSASGNTDVSTSLTGTSNNANLETGNDTQSGSANTNAIDKTNGVHTGRLHGNIGVTTSQQMLESELKISKWNIYEEITDLFLSEFCIYLY